MSKSIYDARHVALVEILIEKRKEAGIRQVDLAKAVGKQQSFVARLESGQRRIDVVDLIKFGELLDFDPIEVIKDIMTISEPS